MKKYDASHLAKQGCGICKWSKDIKGNDNYFRCLKFDVIVHKNYICEILRNLEKDEDVQPL